eukprot:m51a1_g12402 hypothetical protein (333) ;mRNA; r:689920-691050
MLTSDETKSRRSFRTPAQRLRLLAAWVLACSALIAFLVTLGRQTIALPKPRSSVGPAPQCRPARCPAAALATLTHPSPLIFDPDFTVPCIIHRTKKSIAGIDEASLPASYHSWVRKNPGCLHIVWDDISMLGFIEQRATQYLSEYLWLKTGVERSDFFRYLVLLEYGGVYTDWDTECLRPIRSWAFGEHGVAAVVGVEWDRPYAPGDDYQFVQWTLASAPNHTIVRRAVEIVAENVRREMAGEPVWYADAPADNQIIKRTGPLAWTKAVLEHLAGHSTGPKEICDAQRPVRVDDTVYLPVWGFSPGVGHSRSRPPTDPQACVRHMFEGSWKD